MTRQNLAFVFPGQGSQKVGMLADMASRFPVVEQTFAEASDVLSYDLWKMVQDGTQEELNQTERTQPILLAASVALWRVWNEVNGAQPKLMAGHSLGEWSALVCSGVVSFNDAVRLVQQRGLFMQEAVPAGVGAMAAVLGLEDHRIVEICAEASGDEVVSAVNFNSPGQVVIAGHAAAVARAVPLLKAAGAKRAMSLPVSAPFHTSLMQPAADRLAEQIMATTFSAPKLPVVHNVTAETELSPDAIKSLMIKQISAPVLWTECVKTLADEGVKVLVECGPGSVLAGLTKRIDKGLTAFTLDGVENLEKAVAELL